MPITAKLSRKFYERFDSRLEQRLAQAAGTLRSEIADLRIEMRTGFADLGTEMAVQRTFIAETRASLIKWMFVFWTGMTVTNVGIMFALVRLVG